MKNNFTVEDPSLFSSYHLKEPEVFRPIHYLGSKLRMLDFIEETINSIDPSEGKVCDLFAGSCSVSHKLSMTREVTAVDIQEYSRVIGSALLNSEIPNHLYQEQFLNYCRNSKYSNKILETITPLITYENNCIELALKGVELESLCDLLENGSIISHELKKTHSGKKHLGNNISKVLTGLKSAGVSDRQSQITRYFGGIYFSYKQATQIDIILEFISSTSECYKDWFLSVLLSSVSECVNTVGKQFAQPIRPRKSNGDIKPSIGNMASKDRKVDLFDVFEKWLGRYSIVAPSNYTHTILKMDYSDALNQLNSDTKVVYADPPYTRDHYSRFYHVLETIALRDLPQISTIVKDGQIQLSRGLYRTERHQSPFCIRSQAPKAFEQMFSKVSSIGAKLILSYSPYDESKKSHPRVVTMTQLTNLAKQYYKHVEVISPGNFVHSKLNHSEKHLDASSSAEVLIVCS